MKMFKTAITLVATLTIFVAVNTNGSQMDPFPIEVKSEPVPFPTAAGPINLQVTVILKSVCQNAKLIVSGVENLQYEGDTVWNLPSNPEDTTILNLHMIIPENDTSGIGFTCYFSERGKFQSQAYFVVDPEKVSFHHGNPRRVSRTPIGVPANMSDPPMTEELRRGKQTTCYEDEDGNLVPIDSVVNGFSPAGKRVGTIDQNGNFIPLDSLLKLSSESKDNSTDPPETSEGRSKVWAQDAKGNQLQVDRDSLMNAIKEQKIEAEYDKMREMEKSPLTENKKQYIKIGGKEYVRSKGEFKFHLIETTTDPVGYAIKYRDSLNTGKGKVFEYDFDLRDSSHWEYAKNRIPDLMPTDSVGFYRATVDWQTVLDFRQKGIVFHKIGWKPKGGEPDKSNTFEKKKLVPASKIDSRSLTISSQTEIFFEGFEGVFPGNSWNIGDSNSSNGLDYWGFTDSNCAAYSGNKSVWCSAVGYQFDYLKGSNFQESCINFV